MNATRTVPESLRSRIQGPPRHERFVIPLPLRRERRRDRPSNASTEMWWGREVHPEIHGPLRGMAVMVLWLIVVLAMIWLFAEFWF